jgi:hypothetical protein
MDNADRQKETHFVYHRGSVRDTNMPSRLHNISVLKQARSVKYDSLLSSEVPHLRSILGNKFIRVIRSHNGMTMYNVLQTAE